jgi:hypothetical protein
MPDYVAAYPVGTDVNIASEQVLRAFIAEWEYHHPLALSQLQHAGITTRVARVPYYHGGAPLYELSGVAGIWHERCLTPARSSGL